MRNVKANQGIREIERTKDEEMRRCGVGEIRERGDREMGGRGVRENSDSKPQLTKPAFDRRFQEFSHWNSLLSDQELTFYPKGF